MGLITEALMASYEISHFCGRCIQPSGMERHNTKCVRYNEILEWDKDFKQWVRLSCCEDRDMGFEK